MAHSGNFGGVRELKSGRWQARYMLKGKTCRAPRTFSTEKDALAWLNLRESELYSGVSLLAVPKPEISVVVFGAYAAENLAARDLKPRTRVLYQQQLDRHILPRFGKMALYSITSEDVTDWYHNIGPEAPTARAHAYALMFSIMRAAAARTEERPPLIPFNPCLVDKGAIVHRRRRIKPATVPELGVIVENMPEHLRAAVLIAAWGGLRFGELAALRRCDIDGAVLNIERAVVRLPGIAPDGPVGRNLANFVVQTPKSEAGDRTVTLPEAIMPAIHAHLDRLPDRRPGALLFPSTTGGFMAVSSLNKYWYIAREAAGRPDLRWHDLRHTQAVFAAQTGATLSELMQRMGHSTVTAALRYQHAAAGADARIAARLSELASGAK